MLGYCNMLYWCILYALNDVHNLFWAAVDCASAGGLKSHFIFVGAYLSCATIKLIWTIVHWYGDVLNLQMYCTIFDSEFSRVSEAMRERFGCIKKVHMICTKIESIAI